MNLRQTADAVGIEQYPEALEAFFEKPADMKKSLKQICFLQEQYDLFGEFIDEAEASARQILDDSAYCAWVATAAAFVLESSVQQACTLPAAGGWEKPVDRWLLLHILIPQIMASVAEYQARGFSEDELQSLMCAYKKNIRIVARNKGKPGLDKGYYTWLCLYAKARIFEAGGFEFELRNLPAAACWLQNRSTGEVLAVMCRGTFHRSGRLPLGSRNFEDEAGAFTVVFSEDAENYYGHSFVGNQVTLTAQTFPKALWHCFAEPGTPCLSMHIPAGTDISQPALERAFAEARQILRQRFPEHSGDVIYCNSWLLDPKLEELLGESSRIVGFMKRFAKFPQKDGGTAALSFVFGNVGNYADLPENTGLERKLKALYLAGNCIYAYCGIIV